MMIKLLNKIIFITFKCFKYPTWYVKIASKILEQRETFLAHLIKIGNFIITVIKINSPSKNNKEMFSVIKLLITFIVFFILYIIINIIYQEFYTIKMDFISQFNSSSNFILNISYTFNIFLYILKMLSIFVYKGIIIQKILYINLIVLIWMLILFLVCLYSNFKDKHVNHFIFKIRTTKSSWKNINLKNILKKCNAFTDNIFFQKKKILRFVLVFLSFWIIFNLTLRFSLTIWLTNLGFLSSVIPYLTLCLIMPHLCYFCNIILQFIIQKQIKYQDLYFFNKRVTNNINLITLTFSNTMLYLVREYSLIYYTIFLLFIFIVLLYLYFKYYSFHHIPAFYEYIIIEANTGLSSSFLVAIMFLTLDLDMSNISSYVWGFDDPEQRALEWTEVDTINVNQRIVNKPAEVTKYVWNTTNNFSNRMSAANFDKLKDSSILKMVNLQKEKNLVFNFEIPFKSDEIIVSSNIVACQGKLGNNMLLYLLTKGGFSGDRLLPTYIGNCSSRDIKTNFLNMSNIYSIGKIYSPKDTKDITSILMFTPAETVETGNIYIENNTFVSKQLALLPRPSIYYSDMIRFREQDYRSIHKFFSQKIEGVDLLDKGIEDYKTSVLNLLDGAGTWENLPNSEVNEKKMNTIKSYISQAFGTLSLLSQSTDGDAFLYKQNNGNFLGVYDTKLKLEDFVDKDYSKFNRRDMLIYYYNQKEHFPKYYKKGLYFVFIDGVYVEILHAANWTDNTTLSLSTYIDPENKHLLKDVNTGYPTVLPVIIKQQYNLLIDEDRKSIKNIITYLSTKN